MLNPCSDFGYYSFNNGKTLPCSSVVKRATQHCVRGCDNAETETGSQLALASPCVGQNQGLCAGGWHCDGSLPEASKCT